MKPEFSEILLPHSKLQPESCSSSLHAQVVTNSVNTKVIKWLLGISILFTIIMAIVTTAFIFRYEDKMAQYEERIFSFETELEAIFNKLAEEHGAFEDEELVFGTHPHEASSFDQSDEESDSEGEHFGEVHVQETRSRSKRQIPISNAPTFGPEVERTGDGVPIIEKSYLSSAGVTLKPRLLSQVPTTDSEGLRLYEGLVETGGRNEPRSLDFARRDGLDPILPHHQVSAAWSEKNENRRPRIELKSGDSSSFGIPSTSGPQFANELTYTRSSQRRSSQSSSGTNTQQSGGSSSNVLVGGGSSHPGATFHRNSRVPATGDFLYSNLRTTQARNIQYPPLRKLSVGNGEGEVIARVLQTDNESENDPNSAIASANNGQTATAEASSHRRRAGGFRRQRVQETESSPVASAYTRSHSHSGRREAQKYSRRNDDVSDESGEISIVKAEAFVEGPKPVAAHYVADVSNFTTAHKNYEGNGRLRNADGIFAAWRPAEWMTADPSGDGIKSFVLSPNGVLNIKQTGLYYVYAQIHYLDQHDINGFTVQVNTTPFLQCTTMTETYQAGSKSNSCFTAGVTYLKENDRIIIKDIETNRYSIFKPEKSFFGLMKIGDSSR